MATNKTIINVEKKTKQFIVNLFRTLYVFENISDTFEVKHFEVSYPNRSIIADGHQLSVFQGERLDHPGVALPPPLTTNLHLDGVALPQQQVSPI